VELLTSEELRGWKVENLPGRDRDVSVFLDGSVDEDSLEAVVEGAHEDVLDARVFDVYSGDPVPEGRKSFGVRLEILDDGNVEDAVDDVHERLEGIGGEIRG
ncbi:MAG: hypothetical protein SV760_08270, partial [Halobacteria archaeon]|nr:hypothetical protein [Halobacteria archaeon]